MWVTKDEYADPPGTPGSVFRPGVASPGTLTSRSTVTREPTSSSQGAEIRDPKGQTMSCRAASFFGVLVLALGVSACDATRSVPTGPGESPLPPTPLPASSRAIWGTVFDTAFRPQAGATIEALDGPQAGAKATTKPNGEYEMYGTFDQTTRFQATRDGYLPLTVVHPHGHFDFYLVSSTPPVNVGGEYEMTFIVDPACAGIPDAVRTRSYKASVTPGSFARIPAGMVFNLALGGTAPLDNPSIGVAGDAVGFRLFNDGYPFIVEQVAQDLYLTITGWALVPAWSSEGPPISAAFDGWISALNGPPTRSGAIANCKSEHHRLLIRRR